MHPIFVITKHTERIGHVNVSDKKKLIIIIKKHTERTVVLVEALFTSLVM